jgi:hypothetical protein
MNRLTLTWLLALFLAAVAPNPALASSHSEAPGTAKDRLADDTDLYAWVAPDAPDRVTIVGDWVPLLEPNGGPNFYNFDDEAAYYINVDNVGDAQDHIRFQFRFRTERRNPATFLYNTGVVTSLDDPDLNVRQLCTVTRYDDGVPHVLATDVPVAPNNVGPVSMPDYESLATQAVRTLPDGSKLFIGPRDDPFFVDLGAIFDLLTIRKVPGNKGKGVDGVGGFNCMTIALQVPMTRLTRDGMSPSAANGVIGIYDSVERFAVKTLNGDGTSSTSGPEIQVSRLGMPLVNEVVIPVGMKDRFNATKPTGDGVFLPYVLNPELAGLFTALYGFATPAAPRNDLVAVFLTGIPGLNQPANPAQVPCEMLRLNMTVPPSASPNRFGLLGGDLAGFPNGRRLSDDVVDIAERVVAGATAFTADFNRAPNNSLGDGVDFNDRPFLPYFPYVAPPHSPFSHEHHKTTTGSSQSHAKADAALGDKGSLSLRLRGQNPAPSSRLEFSVATRSRIRLQMFDVRGRLVRTLVDQDAAPGTFTAIWDGRAEDGARAARGVYFARLTAGNQRAERTVVLE